MSVAPVVQRVTAGVVAGARAQGGLSPIAEQAVAQLEQAARQLDGIAPDAAAWTAQVNDWVAKLDVLGAALGRNRQQLFLDAVARRLPPIPGFAALPLPIDPTTLTSGLQKSVSLGPVEVGVSLPVAVARFEVDPNVTRSIGILPPTGASLAVNAGVIRGSGALDFQEGPPLRLAGSFGLKLGTIDVYAFAVLERTDGSFALLLLLGARFSPAIELAFGFSLGGVGGLVGINRRSDPDALRARLASGAVVEALFPADPTRSAPAVLSTLAAVFPASAGSFVVGPTVQLTWLKIGNAAFAQADIGLFVELPGPSRIVLVGRVQAELPYTGSAVLLLRLDVLGVLDFQQKLLGIDASLVGSHVLQVFRIAGDAAFRLHWGPSPYSVLTVGGFFPGYNPAPAVLPPLRRASLALDPGVGAGISLRAEAYFAVTTSSFQLGGRLEAMMGIGRVGLAGWVQLDAIAHFSPFSFHLEGALGFAVRVGSRSLGQLDVHLVIDGPGPVSVRATLEIDILFFDISVSATFRLGSGAGPPALRAGLRQALTEELHRLTNLHAENGDDPHVVQSPGPVTDMALLSPVGRLVWLQARAPLATPIQKVDGIPLGATRTATVSAPGQKDVAREWFSPGAFRDRSNSQALNQSSYEELQAGVAIGFDQIRPAGDLHTVTFVEIYRTDPAGRFDPVTGVTSVLIPFILDRAVEGRFAAPVVGDRSALVTVKREAWVVRQGMARIDTTSETAAHAIAHPAGAGQAAAVAAPLADLVSLGGDLMAVTLTFYGWSRSGAAEGGTRGRYPGRVEGKTILTLGVDDGAVGTTRDVRFLLMGPGDVRGLRPSAILAMAPSPGDQDVETTKCPHVELAAPDLPWRYAPDPSAVGVGRLQPWIVLVVGTAAEILLEPDGMVTLMPTVTADYDLGTSARWAHAQQEDAAPRISRLLSERLLRADAYHLAAIVPAFNHLGAPSWRPGERVTIPVYQSWHFKTAPDADDFASLATKLLPIETTDPALSGLGFAPVRYPTTPPTGILIRGALAPIGSIDGPLLQAVGIDLQGRRALAAVDEEGRPIIGLPRYGDCWLADPEATGWGAMLNQDPRHRGAAGLGAWAGILIQEEIAAAAAERAGALFLAAARIRGLTMGLATSGSLWERRLPSDRGGRLMLFGPSFQRMPTGNGTVLEQVTDLTPGRPLPAALFTAAARRALRPGTARERHAAPGALAPGAVLEAANGCPPEPSRAPAGLPHGDNLADWLARQEGREERGPTIDEGLDRARRDPNARLPLDERRIEEALRGVRLDRASLRDLVGDIATDPPRRPCRPVELDALDRAIIAAVDPRAENAIVRRRVLGTIDGLDEEPLAPTEFCPDFDLPAWRVLRDHARDWLLPGAGRLPEHRVVALETNSIFSDAFLVGLNTQALGELRWRNIPIRSGCTPLRRFWERVNPGTNSAAQDILGILEWPTTATDTLGGSAHVPPGSPGVSLVLLFHTPLFRRYPGTLVYLFPDEDPAGAFGQKPDVEAGPGKRIFPSYQGQIEPNFTFFSFPVAPAALKTHWVVVEEVQRGYRFYNPSRRVVAATDGGAFAAKAFVDPTRVLIQGTGLDPTA